MIFTDVNGKGVPLNFHLKTLIIGKIVSYMSAIYKLHPKGNKSCMIDFDLSNIKKKLTS